MKLSEDIGLYPVVNDYQNNKLIVTEKQQEEMRVHLNKLLRIKKDSTNQTLTYISQYKSSGKKNSQS